MPSEPHLLVIDPSIVWPEDAGVAAIVDGWPGTHRVLMPCLRAGDGPMPGDGYDVDAVVVMGSRASVNDDRPWLSDLGTWIDPLLDGRRPIPLFGICFGHQLIAARAGGRVAAIRPDRSEERGVVESRFEPSVLVPNGGVVRVVASHGEVVKALPSGFRIVASRERVPVDALEHVRLPIVSVQFHPEARAGFLAARGIEPGPQDRAAFEDQGRILERFRRLALEFRSRRSSAS